MRKIYKAYYPFISLPVRLCFSCFILLYQKNVSLQLKNLPNMTNNRQGDSYNRIKVVLVEQGKTSRWLAEQIGK